MPTFLLPLYRCFTTSVPAHITAAIGKHFFQPTDFPLCTSRKQRVFNSVPTYDFYLCHNCSSITSLKASNAASMS